MQTISSDLSRLGWDDSFAADFDAIAPPATLPGRVVLVSARSVVLACAAGQRSAVLASAVRASAPEGGVTAGDWVVADDSTVVAVLPRRSVLLRRAAGAATVAQAVAANVDTVFIAVPLGAGVRARKLERSLAMAWSSGARPVVLLTKADLSGDLAADIDSARAAAAGARVIAVSVHGGGIDAVRGCIPPARTGAVVGPSGAGKSTLINALRGDDLLATAAVRGDGRGRHTTTHRELVELPWGGLLIDTPGMREMGLWDAHGGIEAVFGDVGELARLCRFSDCAHQGEPGCAVQVASRTDPGVLDRLSSMRKLEREQRRLDAQVDARLRAESRRERRRFARAIRDQPHR